ncbi:hypothetical protein EG348_01630 [Chryseobacterium sp. G0201]|nr:hypothetical protein EG348_01630 [Chryseobacterium sp. G0201]
MSVFVLAQVGINEINPTATLDIKSKGNTNATKALEVNNSSGAEIFTVLDNGNVGVNITNPTAKLHTNGSIRYENLPVVSGSVSPLAIKSDGTVGTYVPEPTKYLYMEMASTVTTSSFPLSDTGVYTSIPLTSAQSVTNTIIAGFGTDTSATLNVNSTAISSSNVRYISFPDPGIYKINLNYYTSCTGSPADSSSNMLGIGTALFKANSASTSYNRQAVVRYNGLPRRNDTGTVIAGPYNFAIPHTVFLVFETTAANEKIALFVNYGFGDTFTSNVCSLATPAGLSNKITMNISKL